MKVLSRIAAAILAAGVMLASAPATADRLTSANVKWSGRDDGWAAVDISPGCRLIWFGDHIHYEEGNAATYPDSMITLRVTASCGANGLAEGPIEIELIEMMTPPPPGGFLGFRTIRKGTARNGVLQGVSNQWRYEMWPDEPGVWKVPMPSFPGMDTFYGQGCEYDNSSLQQPTTSYSFWGQCDPAAGARLRAELLGQSAEPPQQQTAPLSPTARLLPAAPTPAPAASSADVWATCIERKEVAPDGGIQQLWRLHNNCSTAVIVRYCFRAQFEAAGDENLCRRREMRTHEINAHSFLTFAFNLMPAGTVLTDGRTVTSNGLTVPGFACTGGNFPDAYFDSDGSFRSRGC